MYTHNMMSSASEPGNWVAVVEYTDPFCSWAWSTEPKLRRLRLALGTQASWRRVFGILVDGRPAADCRGEGAIADQYEHWDDVVSHTGAPLPLRLERVAASSWPAARAAKAAELQGESVGDLVLRRLRESLFLDGRPADGATAIAAAVEGVPGLDVASLVHDLETDLVRDAVKADWEETRHPVDEVLGLTGPLPHPGAAAPDGARIRYRFPTVLVTGDGGVAVVPGWRPYEAYVQAVGQVAPGVRLDDPVRGGSRHPFGLFETLSSVELEQLTGSDAPPGTAVRLETRSGAIWARPERADSRRRRALREPEAPLATALDLDRGPALLAADLPTEV